MNKIIICIFLFLLSNLAFASPEQDLPDRMSTEYENGVVVEVISEKDNKELDEIMQSQQIKQLVRVKVLSGDLKGKEITVENQLTSNPAYDINLKAGDRVLLSVDKFFKSYQIYVAAKDRSFIMIFLISLFGLSLLFVAKNKGARIILAIATSFAFTLILFNAMLGGINPVLATFFILVLSSFAFKFILRGINLQTICASLSTSLNLLLGGVLAFFFIQMADLNGFHSDEAIMLHTIKPELSIKGILAASIMIAVFGVLMHICSSISSYIYKFKQEHPESGYKQVFEAGKEHGINVLMTMTNVLIYAYLGIMIFLFLMFCEIPFLKFINLNVMVTLIITTFIAGINLVLSVPVTSHLCTYLTNKFVKK